jgi:hypothetical protein
VLLSGLLSCLVVAAGCSASVARTNSNSSSNSAGAGAEHTTTCPGQELTCAQLVELGLTYPYPREPGSYLFVDGTAYPYVSLGHQSLFDATVRSGRKVLTARSLLERLGLGAQAAVARTPVIAYGSNANVDALKRKFVTPQFSSPAVIPVVEGRLDGFDVSWAPHFAFNGALPATIVPSQGTSVSVWVTWLDSAQLTRMNATEEVGELYSYGMLTGAGLDVQGPDVTRAGLYVDCFGALRIDGGLLAVAAVPARDRRFEAADSRQALRRVAPVVGWHGSAFALVLDNVRSPRLSDERSRALELLGVQLPEPGYSAIDECAST